MTEEEKTAREQFATIPENVAQHITSVVDARAALKEGLGREPDVRELSDYMERRTGRLPRPADDSPGNRDEIAQRERRFSVLPIPDDINPGIRALVEELNREGWRTTDSGDGQTHDYACDRPNPYVAIIVRPEHIYPETMRVVRFFTKKRFKIVSGIDDLERLDPETINLEAGLMPSYDLGWIDVTLSKDSPLVTKVSSP